MRINLLAKRVIGVMAALALVTGMLGFVSVDKIYAAGKIHLKKTSVTVQVKKTYQQTLINKKSTTTCSPLPGPGKTGELMMIRPAQRL